MKRILLFVMTNLAVVVVLGVVASLLRSCPTCPPWPRWATPS